MRRRDQVSHSLLNADRKQKCFDGCFGRKDELKPSNISGAAAEPQVASTCGQKLSARSRMEEKARCAGGRGSTLQQKVRPLLFKEARPPCTGSSLTPTPTPTPPPGPYFLAHQSPAAASWTAGTGCSARNARPRGGPG